MIQLDFENHTKTHASAAIFENILKNAEKIPELQRKLEGGEGEGSITLTLVGDREIQNLNAKYRQKNTPTDVLSFNYLEDRQAAAKSKAAMKNQTMEKPPELIGEIIISADTAGRQAKEHGYALEAELKNLFAHGLLHILGYGHETDEEEAEMNRLASDIAEAATHSAGHTNS